MSESARAAIEIAFDVLYLLVIWGAVASMARRRAGVPAAERRVATLALIAFLLLALGDSGHVGLRVAAYALGSRADTAVLLGVGTVATAITVTLFYVLMLAIWRYHLARPYGPFGYILLGAALLRLVLLALPQNQWYSPVPVQPWSTIRNLPLLVQGLGVAYLFLRAARAGHERTFGWVGAMILVSFACYVAVILWVQQVPLLGMLMIPKTIAYLAICLLLYGRFYRRPAQAAAPARA